jgi:hypothetical protein
LRLTAGVAAVVVFGTGAGAVVYVRASAPVTDRDLARCYTVASLGGGNDFFGTTIAKAQPAGTPGIGQVEDALGVCAAVFRQDILVPGRAGVQPRAHGEHRVPPLVACVLPGGIAAVFPGHAGTCHKLGLPRAAGEGSPTHV